MKCSYRLGYEGGGRKIAVEYNDTVIYPDKVRINLYYLDHYSFAKDFQMILLFISLMQEKRNLLSPLIRDGYKAGIPLQGHNNPTLLVLRRASNHS